MMKNIQKKILLGLFNNIFIIYKMKKFLYTAIKLIDKNAIIITSVIYVFVVNFETIHLDKLVLVIHNPIKFKLNLFIKKKRIIIYNFILVC